jgi:DNA mismatch repair protein MutS
VAKMAGMPAKVIETANEILVQLEKSHSSEELTKKAKEIAKRNQQLRDFQLSFIQLADPLLDQIKEDILNTNIDILTPIEALMKLNEIKKLIEK